MVHVRVCVPKYIIYTRWKVFTFFRINYSPRVIKISLRVGTITLKKTPFTRLIKNKQ